MGMSRQGGQDEGGARQQQRHPVARSRRAQAHTISRSLHQLWWLHHCCQEVQQNLHSNPRDKVAGLYVTAQADHRSSNAAASAACYDANLITDLGLH